MPDHIFRKIIDKQVPATIVFEDDRVLAFRDVSPKAPVHVLVVPKQDVANVAAARAGDEPLLGHLLTVAAAVARQEGLAESGYRLVINTGRDAGESVPHLHVHLLGGRALAWPPG